MAQFQISPATETSAAISFTTTAGIRIDSIDNKYSMDVNFEKIKLYH